MHFFVLFPHALTEAVIVYIKIGRFNFYFSLTLNDFTRELLPYFERLNYMT